MCGRRERRPLSIAEELTAKLNSMGLEKRSLPAEEGILLLSGRLEAGFLETGTVTGAAEWYEVEGCLEPLELWAIGFLILLFFGQSLLWMLQRRKKRYARLLAFSLIWGSALYGLLLGFLGSGIAVGSEAVTTLYREKALKIGLAIGGAGVFGAVLSGAAGVFLPGEQGTAGFGE